MTKLHDSHQAAPPGSKVQTTQAPTSTMHHGTTLHAKAQSNKTGMQINNDNDNSLETMTILPSKM